jgi:RNA recognition motif-containing protein
MQAKLYVGNLSYDAGEEDIKSLFAKYGNVQTVSVISDRRTGRSKGFAFVEMSSSDEAQKAMELNGTDFMGRNLQIAEARPMEKRERSHSSPRGGGFGGGGGGHRRENRWGGGGSGGSGGGGGRRRSGGGFGGR